jgi:hypothetical protein
MPSREGSNLRPWWRFCHASNKQKVTQGGPPPQRDVKNEGRSGYMYENTRRSDNLTSQIRAFVQIRSRFCRKLPIVRDDLPGVAPKWPLKSQIPLSHRHLARPVFTTINRPQVWSCTRAGPTATTRSQTSSPISMAPANQRYAPCFGSGDRHLAV